MAGAALRPVRIGERCVQFRAKRLEFHRSLEGLELVTEIAQPLQSIIEIEKSRLPSHRIISDPPVTMESKRQRIGEVEASSLPTGAWAPNAWSNNTSTGIDALATNEPGRVLDWVMQPI